MIRYCSLLIGIAFILCNCNLKASEKTEQWGFGFQPIIGYDDDASWTLGGSGAFYYNPHPEDTSQELDELDLIATYSVNEGANIRGNITKNLAGNNRVLSAELGWEKYTEYFYGIEGNSEESNKWRIGYIDVPLNVSYSFNVVEHFYVNVLYDLLYHEIDAKDKTSLNETVKDGTIHCSGIGIGLNYKTTNPGLYKRKGFQVGLTSICYSPRLLSSSAFEITSLNCRYYIPFLSRCVLGFQVRTETSHGNVPYHYLPTLGGNKLVRGFKSSRYNGKQCVAGQAELRFPLWWRFGATVFFGGGEVANTYKDFGKNLKIAGGIGFRFAVQTKQNINIRFDAAYNSDGDIVKYIKLKEAF